MKARPIHRRRFLQGAIALPLLPSLMGATQGKKAPKRLVCVGTQLGWYKPDFFANNPSEKLDSLAELIKADGGVFEIQGHRDCRDPARPGTGSHPGG